MSEEEYRNIIGRLAKQVRDHTRRLAGKAYWEQLDSPDFVVLFLPSEHLFSAALRADPDLVDFAAEQRIIIASPTLILSLLRVVGLSWRQVELAKNAQEISSMASELYKRLAVFGSHMEKVGKGLQGAINSYNSAVGSLERKVLPQARKIKELHVNTGSKDLAELEKIDNSPRSIESRELLTEEAENKAKEEGRAA
jgi:DNA recombination protein RmuC